MTAYRILLLAVLVPAWIAATVAAYRACYRWQARARAMTALLGAPEQCSCPLCAQRTP